MIFTPLIIKNLNLKNRIVMPPMAQYSAADDGLPNSWHFIHYATRAIGGVGLIMVEATGVERGGRITDRDLGLWNEEQKEALKPIISECKKYGVAMGIQLGHAGRKSEVKDMQPVAPSELAWSADYPVPQELTYEGIQEIIACFKNAARRANEAGFDVLEIHAAHGYLIHQFLSPLSNVRQDKYGGSTENRTRILTEIISAVQEVWTEEKPLFVRVSADDYLEGGINIEEMIRILSLLKESGIDVIHVSSGGLLPAKINLYQGYQVNYSKRIRDELGFRTVAVGLITEPEFANGIIEEGEADLVALGRELLRNPYWPMTVSNSMKIDIAWPRQYERARPK